VGVARNGNGRSEANKHTGIDAQIIREVNRGVYERRDGPGGRGGQADLQLGAVVINPGVPSQDIIQWPQSHVGRDQRVDTPVNVNPNMVAVYVHACVVKGVELDGHAFVESTEGKCARGHVWVIGHRLQNESKPIPANQGVSICIVGANWLVDVKGEACAKLHGRVKGHGQGGVDGARTDAPIPVSRGKDEGVGPAAGVELLPVGGIGEIGLNSGIKVRDGKREGNLGVEALRY